MMQVRTIRLRGRRWRAVIDRMSLPSWWTDNIETRIARLVGRRRMKQMRVHTKDFPSFRFVDVFRATDRTLTDDEVNAAFAKIQKDIAADGKISVRA